MSEPLCYNRMLEEKYIYKRLMQEEEISQTLCNNLDEGFKARLEGVNLTIPFEIAKFIASKQVSMGKYPHYKQ